MLTLHNLISIELTPNSCLKLYDLDLSVIHFRIKFISELHRTEEMIEEKNGLFADLLVGFV